MDAAAGRGVSGRVMDEGDQPIGNAVVLGCTQRYCLMGRSTSSGEFDFEVEAPTRMIIKVAESASTRRAEGIQPLNVADARIDVGTIFAPSLPAGAELASGGADPQTLELGDGLELTVRRADLMPVLGTTLRNLAARAVPIERRPRFDELEEEIVAVYALFPFATASSSPVAVRAPSDLPNRTAVHFRTVEELDGRLSEPVLGHADGTFVSTDPGLGIEKLTWLIVSQSRR